MFYQFMKWYLGWMVKLHYRRVFIKGDKLVPNGRPVIFASNHPASFIEPIILATSLKQSMHFLVLGSYIKSRWLQWFFRGVHMVPIFRRDIAGDQSIEKNKSTFRFVYEALARNSHILIYPESHTQFIYKVRPLKKGIARMSRGFLERGTHKEMYIQPVGVNFFNPSYLRSDVFLHIGEPIPVSDITGEEQAWYNKLLREISDNMKKVAFHIGDEARHETAAQLVRMIHFDHNTGTDIMVSPYKRDEIHVDRIMKVVESVNGMDEDNFQVLAGKVQDYMADMSEKGLDDRTLTMRKPGLLFYILLILGIPFTILGTLIHGPGLLIAALVREKWVKRAEFRPGVFSAVPAVLTLLYFLACLLLGILFSWHFILLAFIVPLSIYFMVYHLDIVFMTIRFLRREIIPSETRGMLINKRKEIFQLLKKE